MPGQNTGMQGYPRPCNALHVRHGSSAVDVGAMPSLFGNDAENAERGRVAGDTGRHRRMRDQGAVVIEPHRLIGDRNDNQERTFRRVGLISLGRLGSLVGALTMDPRARVMVPERSVLRPKQKLGVSTVYSKKIEGTRRHSGADGSGVDMPPDSGVHDTHELL